MKFKFLRLYKTFRFKILLSFFSFLAIILVCVLTYFLINDRQNKIQEFKTKLTAIQNKFLENNRKLEYFILIGYHQPTFYSTEKQKDIDSFLIVQANQIKYLGLIKNEAKQNRIQIDNEIIKVINLNKNLLDSVALLKSLYLERGYQYYGTEGKMWKYAHILEDSAIIPKVDILQLRRREKDYLLRGDQKYIREHDELIDRLLKKFHPGTQTGNALLNYRKYFGRLVIYTDRLGINNSNGLYSHVQDGIDSVEQQYAITKKTTEKEVSKLQAFFHRVLIVISILLILLALLLSWYVSRFLTKDIKILNRKISTFVKSRFKDDNDEDIIHSNITEIDHLNKNFLQLKTTLKRSLENLENAVKKEKKASEYKSSFVANISHEIRTPLTGIIGMVHLLKTTRLSDEQQEFTDTLDFSANHLLELINMVLDYSKIEAGKLELEKIPFDLKGDITKLVKLFEYKIIEKGLKLILDYRVDATYYLIGDPLRLQQIFLNLLSNAIKFTHNGTITLSVIPILVRKEEIYILFEVKDTGIGIAAEDIDRLFEAFNQISTSISRRFGGTGLGLTISNELIRLMGGEIRVQSEPGKGSIFSFELRFKKGEQIKNRTIEYEKEKNVDGLKILLAEDNIINQKIISKMLEKYHVVIDIVGNGVEAVRLYNSNNYDLVLMDLQMPELDGFEATSIIRLSEKHIHNQTPIVAFSANAYEDDRKKAFDAGVDDFLSKPIKPEELYGIIAKYSIKSTH